MKKPTKQELKKEEKAKMAKALNEFLKAERKFREEIAFFTGGAPG